MRKTIMIFITTFMLLLAMVMGQSLYNQTNNLCSCEDVLYVLLSDKMFYTHLYYGLTDTIYISQNSFCNIPLCKTVTIQDKTVTFVGSDTKYLQNQNKTTQVWNIYLTQKDKRRVVCEVEALILNHPDGPEHEHSIVVLELKKRRGQYQVKKANCFYVVGKTFYSFH